MIPRVVKPRLLHLMGRFPAVALLGPRQAGKTTLARSIADELAAHCVYLDLKLPSDRAKPSDAEFYLSAHENRLVILDEIHRAPGIFQTLRGTRAPVAMRLRRLHRAPGIFQTLRGLIDRRRRKGIRARQFLVLGSASMDLLRQSAESLAGRIACLELAPFVVPEVETSDLNAVEQLWVRSGFPDSFLAADDSSSLE